MTSDPPSREREIVLQRFLELTPADQLQTYRAMRDLLAARCVRHWGFGLVGQQLSPGRGS